MVRGTGSCCSHLWTLTKLILKSRMFVVVCFFFKGYKQTNKSNENKYTRQMNKNKYVLVCGSLKGIPKLMLDLN